MQKALTSVLFTRLNSHEKSFTISAYPLPLRQVSTALAIFLLTLTTYAVFLLSVDFAASCINSPYCCELRDKISLLDTNDNCLRPVNGTLEHAVKTNIISNNFLILIKYFYCNRGITFIRIKGLIGLI